jgi:integrase
MGVEDYHRAIDVKRIKGERAPAGRMITAEELKALFATCPDTAIGRRDVAILAIMYGCGLRRHEVVGLNLESFSGEHIRFIGKGNKEQVRPLPIWVRSCVRGWLQHRGEKPGALFYAYRRGNHMELDAAGNPIRLAEGSLYGMLKERVGKAGIKISLSPHDFRRTVISNMLAAGDDAHSVQLFIGHANIATTLRYDRRGEEAVEAVAAKIKDPR